MKRIDLQGLKHWDELGQTYTLVDVREDFEREKHHIGGLWIPLGELLSRIEELPQDQTLVFYCRKGIRSQIAIQRLQERHPELDCYNLQGGIGEPA